MVERKKGKPTKVEIMPAMMAAGLGAYEAYSGSYDSHGLVEAIYSAMRSLEAYGAAHSSRPKDLSGGRPSDELPDAE